MEVAQYIREHLLQFKKNGKSLFMIMDAMGQISPDGHPWQRRREACLPMVTAMFNRELGLEYDEVDLQHAVAQGHWFVGSYTMSMQHPVTRKTTPIFKDQSVGDSMFRIVVKSNMTKHMAANLVHEIHSAVEFLDTHPNNAITAKRPRIAKKIPGAAWAADHIKEWAHKAASFVADAHGA
jgi:hypothetical protein